MPSTPPNLVPFPAPSRRRFRWRYLVVAGLGVFLTGAAVLLWSLRMRGEARAIQQTVLASMPGRWERTVELRVGRLPTLCAQTAAKLIALPPAARAGVQAVRSVNLGVYQRRHAGQEESPTSAVLEQVRQVMKDRDWETVVAVSQEHQSVGVFTPRSTSNFPRHPNHLTACVFVLQADELVVVSGDVNLDPLLELLAASESPMRLAWK